MRKFKVGDIVELIEDYHVSFKKGTIFEIRTIDNAISSYYEDKEEYIINGLTNNKNKNISVYAKRCKLIDSAEEVSEPAVKNEGWGFE